MKTAGLPALLRPSQPDVGGAHDGGYLISRGDMLASDGPISMGIDNNWQFGRHFSRARKIPLHAYEGCTGPSYLLRDTRQAIVQRNLRWLSKSALTFLDYHWFFRGSLRRHFREFVGTGTYAYEQTDSSIVNLTEVFERMPGKVFLKIDIEGAEYELLDGLIEQAGTTIVLAIEFHDCAERMAEILDFVRMF